MSTDDDCRMFIGSLFHKWGPAKANDRLPNSVTVLGSIRLYTFIFRYNCCLEMKELLFTSLYVHVIYKLDHCNTISQTFIIFTIQYKIWSTCHHSNPHTCYIKLSHTRHYYRLSHIRTCYTKLWHTQTCYTIDHHIPGHVTLSCHIPRHVELQQC